MTSSQVPLTARKSFKSVVLEAPGEDGTVTRTKLYEPKRRRVSKRWRKLEKFVRRVGKAQSTAADEYLDRHQRSNNKKKNGWIKDLGKNVVKSQRKGLKKVKVRVF